MEDLIYKTLEKCVVLFDDCCNGNTPSSLDLQMASITCKFCLQLLSPKKQLQPSEALSFDSKSTHKLSAFLSVSNDSSLIESTLMYPSNSSFRTSIVPTKNTTFSSFNPMDINSILATPNDNQSNVSFDVLNTVSVVRKRNVATKKSIAAVLPRELITIILRFGRNPLPIMNTNAAFSQRQLEQQTLLWCGLVNRNWRAAATPLLWNDPSFKNRNSLFRIILGSRFSELRYVRMTQVSRFSYGVYTQRLDLRKIILSEPADTCFLRLLASEFPRIRTIRLNMVNCDVDTLHNFTRNCPNLQFISLFARESVQTGKRSPQGVIDTSEISNIGGACNQSRGFANLEGLDLYEVNMELLLSIYSLAESTLGKSLCYLNLGRTWVVDKVVVEIASRCPNLISVWLEENVSITDYSICQLAHYCPHIKTLKLRNCSNITDSSIAAVSVGCLKLEALGISYSQCSNDSLKYLVENSFALNTVYLNDLFLEEASVISLCVARGKSLLNIGLCGLDTVTDNCVYAISKFCPNLEQIDIGGCSVSESSIYHLMESCVHLKTLVVDEESVSDKFLAEIRQKYCSEQFWLEPPLF
ncbi:hypothetical protein HK096_003405 [Nowakowskiella sp. JEL0078]|nr:hypothetical protein HK096_003405 [Nowakowskiella sp. JEL0078]